uniref:U8-Eretoxin-Ek1c_1 n=1 Tax=Eresus cinnaberinus TaxID=175337 RepID=A0A2D0PBZ5_ERECI
MAHAFALFLLVVLSTLVLEAHGSTFSQPMNTQNGYCEGSVFGRIPVGEVSYDDTNCIKYTCSPWQISGEGCSGIQPSESCQLIKGFGHFPDCCPKLLCT